MNPQYYTFDLVNVALRAYTLAGDVPPSYQGCKTTTLTTARVPLAAGRTFCLIKPGRVIGVTVNSVSIQQMGTTPVVFEATVWADA